LRITRNDAGKYGSWRESWEGQAEEGDDDDEEEGAGGERQDCGDSYV